MDQPDRAVRLGKRRGEIIGREPQRQREDRHQPRRHRLHRGVIFHRRGAEFRHVGRPAVEPDQPFPVDDVGMVGGAVAGDVEALAEIGLGVLVDRRVAHGLAAKRQVADVQIADLEGELVGFRPSEEPRRNGEYAIGQRLRHAVVGDDEKPGVFTGAGNRAGQWRRRARLAGKKPHDVDDRYPAVIRRGRNPRSGGTAHS